MTTQEKKIYKELVKITLQLEDIQKFVDEGEASREGDQIEIALGCIRRVRVSLVK